MTDFTTTLPDEDTPVLGNGVEDEVAVDRQDASANNGSVRIQIRETGQSSWDASATGFGEFVGAYDTLTMEFVGREDGERYEVRARTETPYRTGAWTEPVAITTDFPGATALVATVVDETTVDLAWTDNADNEDGQRVVRERRRPDGSWGRQRVVDDAGVNAESYTDDTPQPDREYRYRIQPYTEHASAESNLDTATTPALDGVRDRRVPPTDWRVEVDHPDADQPLTPTVLDGAEWNPRLKAKPQVRIPVPRSSTWEDAPVEGEPIRVWKDGTRLPIEEIQDVERDETQNVIVAVGGTKLDDDVSGIEYPEADAHVAAKEVITEELGWLANVDDPTTNAREDVRVSQALATGDYVDALEGVTADGGRGDFGETDPRTVFNGRVYSRQTAVFQEAEDADGDGVSYFADTEGNDGAWSGNETVRLLPGDAREFEWSIDYTVPENEAEATFVFAVPTDPTPAVDITIDISGGGTETLASFDAGSLSTTDSQFDLQTFTEPLNPSQVGDLPAGTHSIEIAVTDGEAMFLDFAHLRDDRFDYDTDDTTPVDEVVTGWQQYPAAQEFVFEPITSVEQVVAGQIDVDLVGGGVPAGLALRNDTANAWTEAAETASHAVDFADASQLLQARITLGRESSGSTSGAFGDTPQQLDLTNIYADLVNTPVLIDFVHSGTYERLLNRIANAGDFIWELRPAPNADAPYRVEWTQPGQRVADTEPEFVSFEGRRTIKGSYQRVIAEGKSKRVTEQVFTTAGDYGLGVGLGNAPIETGSETVYDVDDRSTEYERLIDYRIDHADGALIILEGGGMNPNTQYQIDYEWRFQGEYTQLGVDNPDTLREQFPDAASDRECEQLALAVVREVAEPLEEAEVTVRETDPDRSLVASIPADKLPFEGPLKVRDVSAESREVSLTLGSREDARDVVSEFNDRISAVARNV